MPRIVPAVLDAVKSSVSSRLPPRRDSAAELRHLEGKQAQQMVRLMKPRGNTTTSDSVVEFRYREKEIGLLWRESPGYRVRVSTYRVRLRGDRRESPPAW